VLRENLPVGVALLLAQVVSNFPPLVVGYFLDMHDVGIYSAALKLMFLLLLADRLFSALFLPVVARYVATRETEVPFLMTVSLKVLVIGLLPLIALAFALARPAVVLVFGPGYENAAPLFRIMTGFVGLTVLNSLYVCALIGSRREQAYSRAMMFGTAILAGAALVLTPIFGTTGASVALLVGEGATLGMMARRAREVAALPPLRTIIRPAGAFIIMAGLLWIVRPTALACITGLVAYAGIIIGSSALNREELRFLRERFV
jgi:O-antigen/teichoic acid export membrane protein